MKRALLVVIAALVVAGCGEGDSEGTGGETTTGHQATPVTVYFLRDDKVWPVRREVHEMGGGLGGAMNQLLDGPTDDEESDLGLSTAVPEEGEGSVVGGVAKVETDAELSDEARAQIVYTATEDPSVTSVEIEGQSYTRADFEEQTPAVLVESPLAGDAVSSPLEARGTANTFEATFSFEIKDASGEVIASDFVTATSGSGMRGTFEFAQPFVVVEDQDGTLVVFELSAEDGSRLHEVEIPIELRE